MSSPSFVRMVAVVAFSLMLAAPAAAQEHDHGPAGEQVGSVHFPVSCEPAAQERFDRAVAMLHSFWFPAAMDEFAAVAEADPDCAMAHWGTAMTLWGNPMTRSAPLAENAERAAEAIARAEALADGLSHRERMWIDAAAALYEDRENLSHLERMKRHEEALAALADMHPEDTEAHIFLGRIMVANASPADPTFAKQKEAAAILEPRFEEQPDHPGIAHYIIHAFDAPPIAGEGLEAAKRYADIAPAAPHALHMPSHIFTRLGHWDESIETNRRAAEAEATPDAAVHPLDYMVYAYLQQGRDQAAGEVLERAADEPVHQFYGGMLGYNAVAMPARYALERGDWQAAAEISPPTDAMAYVEAVPRFARALGLARTDRPDAARDEIERLEELEAALEEAGQSDWATRVSAQRLAAEAWVEWAEGDRETALDLARQAAEREATVEKHPVTPGPLLPARELYGDMLMKADRPADALAAYRATLDREPRRARALYGAGRAAEAIGDAEAAAEYAKELLEVMRQADPDRPEPAWAREVVAT